MVETNAMVETTEKEDPPAPLSTAEKDAQQKVSLNESFTMMQDFLLHKGVLSESMSQEDLDEFLEGVQ